MVARKTANATSYALGMIAALPEFGPRKLFHAATPTRLALMRNAPHRGRFVDGYDRVADLAMVAIRFARRIREGV